MEQNYPIHILQIKLWEWEGVFEKSNMSIIANGPNEFDCPNYDTAVQRIKELKATIEFLTNNKLF